MVFLGSPFLAAEILKHLLKLKKNVQAVWTNNPKPFGRGRGITKTPVSKIACDYNIPCYEREKISELDVILLRKLNPELMLVVAFGQILPAAFFSLPEKGSFNLHFSLLPKYRGASPLQSAILNGDQETGITFQKINQKMDAGKIVLQKKIALDNCDYSELLLRALKISRASLKEFFEKIKNPHNFREQDSNQATYCYKIKKKDGEIISGLDVKKLINQFLAFRQWPKIFFYYNEKKFNIIDIDLKPILTPKSKTPFQTKIICKDNQLFVELSNGLIEIKTIQKEGKKELSVKDFLNGNNLTFPLTLRT